MAHFIGDEAEVDAGQRVDLLLTVTADVLSRDESLTFCTGLRLIDAARTAVARLQPEQLHHFDSVVMSRLRALLEQRFGLTPPHPLH